MSLYDYYYHPEDVPTPHTQVRLTDGGRKVYGGGGITPYIKVPPVKLNDTERTLVQNGAFYSFAQQYLAVHKTIPEDFHTTPEVVAEFQKYLAKQKIPVTSAELQKNLDFVKLHIREKLVYDVYGANVAGRIQVENDPLVEDAVKHMPQAKELITNIKQYMASMDEH